MECSEDIYYQNCPHFTVGRVDQWGEHGYLLYEGRVYFYEEDRKEHCGSTRSPMTIEDFLSYAERHQISVPADFMTKLTGAGKVMG